MSDFDNTVYLAGQAKAQIRRHGKPTDIKVMEAMVGKQHEAGLKGSAVAQKDALQALRSIGPPSTRRPKRPCGSKAGPRSNKVTPRALFRAKAKGEAIDDILPHRDDIVLGELGGVRIVGPVYLVDPQLYRKQARLRDFLYKQQLLDDALNGIAAADRPSSGTALVLGVGLNDFNCRRA